MFQVKKWRWLTIVACVVAVLALAGGLIAWRASRALRLSQQEFRAEREIKFVVRPYLSPVNVNFETVRSPEVFAQVAQFQDHLYIAGPAGLSEHDLGGAFLREFQAGRELPGSPLVAMAVTQLADATRPELLLATADQGIFAFDGQRFRQIYPADADVRAITTILPASAGRLLIGTKKRGVLLYDGHTFQELHPTLAHLYVQALAGTETDLWVGTLEQGVKHWHAGTTETFSEEQGLSDRQVQAIALAGDKTYVGTPVGVAEFDQGRFSRVLAEGTLVTALLVHDNELWIGSEDQGVLRVPLAPKRSSAVSQTSGGASEPEEMRQFLETDGGVLVLTRKGLFEVKGHVFGWKNVLEPRPAVLSDRNISALAVDKNGQLWVGYFDRGLDVLPNGPGRAIHLENDHVFCVNRIWPDPKGQTVEVGTANGLVRFDSTGKPQQVLGKADGLIADHVTDVVPYGSGIAIATPAGITFLDTDGARSMYAFHGLVNNHVYALGASGDGLMVGTLGGLSSLQKGFVKANYTAGNSGLKQNWITAVVRVGDEWMVGTYGSGVMGLDDTGKFHGYETATVPMEINPNAMLVTRAHVFVGTLGKGLFIFDREKRRWTNLAEGLPSANITALAESSGYIYVGTDNGLVRIEERKLQP
jgi:ligand-binding sensor domain-containing protein